MFAAHPAPTAMLKPLVALVATGVALFALAACAGSAGDPGATQTASNGDTFNDADVAFASGMIPHHAQAIQLVNMTMGRDLDPEVQQLAEEIRAVRATEVEQMVDWLTAWDKKIPRTAIDHGNAHSEGGAEMHHDLPGMMSPDDMAALEGSDDSKFQDMWLEMMIEHHKGAIEMAETEQESGGFAPAVDLAKQMEAAQEQQIEAMQGLLDS
jgi:uncharacterized protein (DUF305 family)